MTEQGLIIWVCGMVGFSIIGVCVFKLFEIKAQNTTQYYDDRIRGIENRLNKLEESK